MIEQHDQVVIHGTVTKINGNGDITVLLNNGSNHLFSVVVPVDACSVSSGISPSLTDDEIKSLLKAPPLKAPDKTGIKRKNKYLLRVKLGGKMQLVTVICRNEPYQKTIGKCKKAWYVNVSSYDYHGSVNIKKLREIPE